MPTEGVENVGGPGEVEHHLGRARVLHTVNLSTGVHKDEQHKYSSVSLH
jgi:hypothetical protein